MWSCSKSSDGEARCSWEARVRLAHCGGGVAVVRLQTQPGIPPTPPTYIGRVCEPDDGQHWAGEEALAVEEHIQQKPAGARHHQRKHVGAQGDRNGP